MGHFPATIDCDSQLMGITIETVEILPTFKQKRLDDQPGRQSKGQASIRVMRCDAPASAAFECGQISATRPSVATRRPAASASCRRASMVGFM
jgi:hypothetical protein